MWNMNICPQVRDINKPGSFTLTDFTERSLQSFTKAVHAAYDLGQPLFPIYIQSDGGYAAILYGFMSVMESYREKGMKFAGIVAGTASSAGCVIFLYSDFRYMGKFSSLLQHSIQLSGVEGALPTIEDQLSWYRKENDNINEVISRHLKKPKDWLKNQLKKQNSDDWLISAEDALKLGMATEIRLPSFNLSVSAEFSIT